MKPRVKNPFLFVAKKKKRKVVSDDETNTSREMIRQQTLCQLVLEIKSFNPLEEAMRRAVLVHTVLLPCSFYPYIRQK